MPKRFDQTTNATAVAAADQIPFITAAGVTSYVTGDEFAASAPLSSRYVSKADEKYRWVAAAAMGPTDGSPTLGNHISGVSWSVSSAWLFDAASAEIVGFSLILPDYWTTFHVDLYWTNYASSSGNVVWNMTGKYATNAENPETAPAEYNTNLTVAAPTTAGEIKISRFATGASNSTGKVLFNRVFRSAADASDTLANDAAALGVLFTRAS